MRILLFLILLCSINVVSCEYLDLGEVKDGDILEFNYSGCNPTVKFNEIVYDINMNTTLVYSMNVEGISDFEDDGWNLYFDDLNYSKCDYLIVEHNTECDESYIINDTEIDTEINEEIDGFNIFMVIRIIKDINIYLFNVLEDLDEQFM